MSSIWQQSTGDNAHIVINGCYSFIRARLQQFRGYNLFNREDYAFFAPDPNACSRIFDGFYSILDLEVAAVRGENGVGEVVAGSY